MKYYDRSLHIILSWLLITGLVLCPLTLSGQKQSKNSQIDFDDLLDKWVKRIRYLEFSKINSFLVGVNLLGSAEQLGLNQQKLSDFAKLRLRNNISNIPILNQFPFSDSDSVSFVLLRVWTVGDDYPVALHIKIHCWRPISESNVFENSVLGIHSKNGIEKAVKESFDDLITSFAIAFYKARDEPR